MGFTGMPQRILNVKSVSVAISIYLDSQAFMKYGSGTSVKKQGPGEQQEPDPGKYG